MYHIYDIYDQRKAMIMENDILSTIENTFLLRMKLQYTKQQIRTRLYDALLALTIP